MDFISHSLWGGIAFGRRTRSAFLIAAGISLLPDLLTEGLFGTLLVLGIGGMPAWDHGHPDIPAYPLWAQTIYNGTHSLASFTIAFLAVSVLAGKPVWVLGAWAMHILIDIPTHSINLFPTPFLWPLSDFKINGVGWENPLVLGGDVLLLVVAYSLWMGRANRRNAWLFAKSANRNRERSPNS